MTIIENHEIDFQEYNLLIDSDKFIEYVVLYSQMDSIVDEIIDQEDYSVFEEISDRKSLEEFAASFKTILFQSIYSKDFQGPTDKKVRYFMDKLKSSIGTIDKGQERKQKVITNSITTLNNKLGVQ